MSDSKRTVEIDLGGLGFAVIFAAFYFLFAVTDDKFGDMADAVACGVGGPQVCDAVERNALAKAAEKAAKRAAKAAK